MLDMGIALAELYREAGDSAKSDAFLESYLNKVRSGPLGAVSIVNRALEGSSKRIRLLGSPAPELDVRQAFGIIPSTKLAALRAWCAPCLVTIPETNALKVKYEAAGLVIIGVTRFYGLRSWCENCWKKGEPYIRVRRNSSGFYRQRSNTQGRNPTLSNNS